MKTKTKRLFSVILALVMALSFLQTIVFAKNSYAVNAEVMQYICAPSQYTNSANYGTNIQNTVSGVSSTTSLGDFGGYVIYKFNEPIYNSDKNPYGVDFIVTGNAFNGDLTTQEPGQIWVSQDNINWYAIAGSEHYEDSTDWNYKLTYAKNADGKVEYSDSYSDSGIVKGTYPSQDIYKTVTIPNNKITFDGILLAKQRTASTNNGINTSFGYTDTRAGEVTDIATNPYVKNPATACKDGQIDISLAVNKYGMPVNLDYINYVKVQTATFIDGGIFGEKSTEINGFTIAKQSEEPVGTTEKPKSIAFDTQEIEIKENQYIYSVDLEDDSDFTVFVNSKSNVYINNQYGNQRTYSSIPYKGIVRVVIQSGENEPLVYYFNVHEKSKAKFAEITFSCSDSDIILPKQKFTVYDGIAEEYGYDVAKVDHNGKAIETATFFDALVAAHKEYYKDAFTPDTAQNYLNMSKSFITKAFGKSASASGFLIDNVMPNDGIINNTYGTYTAYSCDTARLNEGNNISYYFYQDTSYWSDYCTIFNNSQYNTTVGKSLSMHIDAYCAMYYGVNEFDTIKSKYFVPVTDGKIYTYSDGVSKLIGTTDSSGNSEVVFNEEGTYTVYVSGTTKNTENEDCQLIISWCEVTVSKNEEKKSPTFWENVLSFLLKIITAPIKFVKYIISLF